MIDNKLKIIAVLKLGENLMKETKVAVFGTGFFYQKQKEKLQKNKYNKKKIKNKNKK